MLLRAGEATLHVVPETGGSCAGWTWRGLPVMRPASDADLAAGNPRRLGAYPLIPFSGRIADGRFAWKGRTIQLPPNFPPEPHTIHGNAWQNAWTVAERAEDRVLLTFANAPNPAWPFPYRAGLGFHLLPDGLDVAIHLHAEAEMPAGFGWHPYFHRAPGAALGFHAERVWLADDRNIPESLALPSGPLGFDPGRALDDAAVDNCYAGWTRHAQPAPPGVRVSIEADPVLDHLVVYTPPGRDYFCTEPATHAPNSINRPEGMRVLAAGEALEGRIRLRLAAA
jgi:aldose 1-epimerase